MGLQDDLEGVIGRHLANRRTHRWADSEDFLSCLEQGGSGLCLQVRRICFQIGLLAKTGKGLQTRYHLTSKGKEYIKSERKIINKHRTLFEKD